MADVVLSVKELQAAIDRLKAEADQLEAKVGAGSPLTPDEKVRLNQASATVMAAGHEVVSASW